jgi:hypothetical protein
MAFIRKPGLRPRIGRGHYASDLKASVVFAERRKREVEDGARKLRVTLDWPLTFALIFFCLVAAEVFMEEPIRWLLRGDGFYSH